MSTVFAASNGQLDLVDSVFKWRPPGIEHLPADEQALVAIGDLRSLIVEGHGVSCGRGVYEDETKEKI